MPGTRKLGRPTAHRMSMLRGLVTQTLEKGRLTTTATRAQETAILAEKMITLGKKNTLAARRQAMSFITKEDVVHKLFADIAPGFAERNGGYTRITLLGPRRGDAAEMAVLELLSDGRESEAPSKDKKGKKVAPKKAPAKAKKPAKKAE